MKLYLAGIYTSNFELNGRIYNRLIPAEKWARDSVRCHLESYHYIHKQTMVDKIRRDSKKVFLDSGAFSAMTKGVEIDLPAYCQYIKRNLDIIEVCSVLDGIGDPAKTLANQQRMEQLGTTPLPCFHYGEDEKYLEYYIAKYEYITLGGMVPISNTQLFHWLDRLWDKYLTDSAGHPRLKVHGFGLTAEELMTRYPWYSVDSSAWVQKAAMGSIMLPELGSVATSHAGSAHKRYNQHVDTMSQLENQAILKVVTDLGFDVDRLRHNYIARWAFNCYGYQRLGEIASSGPNTFKAEQEGLFG